MNVDACNHGKKRITFFAMDSHIMQMIIVENPIVNPFLTCTVIVYLFVLFCTARNRCIESDIPVRFSINTTPVGRGGAVGFARTAALPATGNRTAPFQTTAVCTFTPIDHTISSLTKWCTICINGYLIRNRNRSSTFCI